MNILFLRAGIFSNLNQYLYQTMCRSHNIVQDVDAGKVINRNSLQLSSWRNIVHTLIHSKRYWRQSHSKNTFAFSQMTKYCNHFVRSRTDYDIIFQTQCKFSITENPYSRPYYIYTDLSQKLTDRIWHKWALKGSTKETAAWYRLETEAFHRADKIFTFNNHIKASFVDDYDIDSNKVIVVGSGVNSDHEGCANCVKKFDQDFTLFFLTTEFERQGGPTVIKSLEIIKQNLSDIKLVIAGSFPKYLPKGIETYRNLTRDLVAQLFDRAIIFLMPGILGGLQAVLQAMNQKCVCIVANSNILLKDIIIDQETGFIIPANDSTKLAEKVIDLYYNESLLKKIAKQANTFVRENFTWELVAQRLVHHFND